MKIYAHRGFSGEFKENTKSAFLACKNLNISGIELDVQYTKDKKVVVIHDEYLKRLYGLNLFVKDINFDELVDNKFLDSDARAISLYEYVDIIKDTNLITNVELKNSIFAYEGLEKDVYNIFKSRNLLDKLLISSFNHKSLINFRKLTDSVAIAALESSRILNPEIYLSNYGIDFYHPFFPTVDREMVEKLHDKNIKVNAWTVNNLQTFNLMESFGVDGIITNYPDLKFKESF